MEGVWQVGSFIIHKEWIAVGCALILSIGLLRFIRYFSKANQRKKDMIGNVIFVFVIVYQLSSFLFHIPLTFRYPISVLASPGTWKEWVVAWIAVGIYLFVTTRSNKKLFFEITLYFFLAYILTEFFFLSYQIYSETASLAVVIHMTILSVVFFVFLLLRNKLSHEYFLYILLMLYGMFMSGYSFVFAAKTLFIYIPGWLFVCVIIIALVGLVLSWLKAKKR